MQVNARNRVLVSDKIALDLLDVLVVALWTCHAEPNGQCRPNYIDAEFADMYCSTSSYVLVSGELIHNIAWRRQRTVQSYYDSARASEKSFLAISRF